MELSIIIVNWNSLHYVRECLTSICANTKGLDFEVIVVDNASAGDDAHLLKTEFPKITVIENHENCGFSLANNLGFEHSSGGFIFFLNPDTKVIGPAITTMLARLKSLPDAAAVGCRLLNSDLSVQTSCIQRFPTILNQLVDMESLRLRWPKWKLWGIEPLFSNRQEPSEVEVVSGACLMIKRNVFEKVGLFSGEYFMYAEDVDICYKVRQAGLKTYYVAEASVIHHGGGSTKQRKGSQWTAIMQSRAILRFFQNSRGRFYALMYRVAMGAAALCRLLVVSLVLPFGKTAFDHRILYSAPEKWLGILKWAIGLDRQAPESNNSF